MAVMAERNQVAYSLVFIGPHGVISEPPGHTSSENMVDFSRAFPSLNRIFYPDAALLAPSAIKEPNFNLPSRPLHSR